MPSPSRSPIATNPGLGPVAKSVFGPNVPSPFPSSTEIVEADRFAVARSSFPSLLRSPIATETGRNPVA